MTARAELRHRHPTFLRPALILAAFIHIVIFAFWPELLLKGGLGQILQVTITAVFGVLFFSIAIAGYFMRTMRLWERVLMGVAGVNLIHGG